MTDETIFSTARAKVDPAERAAYLDEACAGDPALRARVEALLQSHEEAGDFLNQPAVARATDPEQPVAPPDAGPNSRIGPYRLLQQIGEGGMGVVWMAEQTAPVRRRVAVKVIKPGMDSAQVLARFEAERQALAMMDHPNIARVLDAGATESGRPYFVMELVKGVPIGRYCDEHRLTPVERLALFVPVCRAVQHAHQKGVIHRDIKPTNILVARYDGRPVPKVIDFGVAKALGPPLTERTLFTGFGSIIGTLEYMSPEQAEFNALDVDTRSDVYSLGVLLYELLTGSTPLDRKRLTRAAIVEALRVIREEEPPRPSTRLSESKELLASISAQRHTEPAVLARLLRGELDWIVMKALEKDRSRRYDTAAGLAKDVERYLNDEPVEACPPTVGYRLRKAFRKNRRLVVTAGAFLAVVTLAAVVGAILAVQARLAQRAAERAEGQAGVERDAALTSRQEAERERDEKQAALTAREAALRQARGLELTLRSELTRPHNPGLALVLAVEGARRNPGLSADNALAVALGDCLEQRTLVGHESQVFACAFSPDGRQAVTGGADETARVWDAATGREIRVLRGHDLPVVQVAYSPDGRRILTVAASQWNGENGAESGPIDPVVGRLWEAESGRLVAAWQDPPAGAAGRDHTHWLTTAASFSPDGRRVVTTFAVYPDGAPQVRDAVTGQLVFTLNGHTHPVVDVAYSPDGRRIATASIDRTAVLWDADTGKPVYTLKHPCGVGRLVFSPDGRRLLTVTNGAILIPPGEGFGGGLGLEDTAGRVWDVASGKEVAVLKWPENQEAVGWWGAFTPDGRRVLTAGADRDLALWDAATGNWLARITGREPGGPGVEFAASIPSGGSRWLLTVADRTAYLRDAATGNVRTVYRGHEFPIHAAALSPDGRRALTAGFDGTARVWDADLGPDAAARRGRWPEANGVALSPDGRALIELPAGRLWDLAAGREVADLSGQKADASLAAFAADGSKVLTVSADHKVRVWDARTGRSLALLQGHTAKVTSAEFDATGARVVTASQDGTARVWDLATGRERCRLSQTGRSRSSGSIGEVSQFLGTVSFSPDGRQVLGAPAMGGKWAAGLWDAQTGTEVRTSPGAEEGDNELARFLPDGRVLTLRPGGVWNAELTRLEVSFGRELTPRPAGVGNAELSRLKFWLENQGFSHGRMCASPDGHLVAAASSEVRPLALFDSRTGTVVRTLSGHEDGITALAFSRDGKLLASGSKDGTARVWDVPTGAERLVVPHPGVSQVMFTPDGLHVVTAGRGARRWPLHPAAEAESRRPRALTAAEQTRFGLDPYLKTERPCGLP